MAIDFNTAPYYDNFDQASNFYRILFKPGRAVQARELTQLQSVLQNQIEAHGSHIFKNGSIVNGGRSHLTYGLFLKVFSGNVDVFEGASIIGAISGATGTVAKVLNAATVNNVSYPAALYLDGGTVGTFIPGETVSVNGTTTTVILSTDTVTYTGPSVYFNIGESIFYINGFFVYCDPQTIVVSKTFIADPSARIGLQVKEQIVTSEDDSSLFDPAVGSNNYFAPGADRLQIELILAAIEYDPSIEDSDQEKIENFVEIANMRYGNLIKLITDADYNLLEDALAKRTFDESGDYTVKPFIAKVKPHLFGNIDQFTVEISPGKAYVRGYGFETIAATNLSLDKAREIDTVEDFPVAVDFARFTDVVDVKGFLNSHSTATFNLHNKNTGAVNLTDSVTYTSSLIGSAKIRYVDHVSSAPDRYSLYLYDLNVKTGNTFSEVKSFIFANVTVAPYTVNASANTYDSANATVITYGVDDTMLFPVPQSFVKTFEPAGTPTISFTSKKLFEDVSFAAGTGGDSGNSIATISVSGSEVFNGAVGDQSDAAIKERYFAANTTGHVLDFTGATGSIELDSSLQQAIIKITNGNSFVANISAITTTRQASPKTKTLTTASVVVDYTATDINVIYLGYPDVVAVSSIEDAYGESYLGTYLLDTGQKDDYYDHAMLIAADGSTLPVLNVNNPNVTITFSYLSHSGISPFFSVDSYTNSGILYENIPAFTSSTGTKYNLADVFDFRPVRAPSSNSIIITKNITPGTTIDCDYQYFLSRADKIIVTKDKSFSVIRGQAAISAEVPKDIPEGMTLYTVNIPPYTKTPSEIKLGFVENRRFTMRDIGKIEKRVDRLEYYTTLSFLEKIANDQKISSSVPGIERFKNGILVDPFAGHGIGDTRNGDYVCSIDNESKILRPAFVCDSLNFTVDETTTTNAVITGDLITPEYSEISYISQTKATRTVNLTPFEVFVWVGQMALSPATDIWHDAITNPDVTVNLNGENDAFTQITTDSSGLTPWATKWNAWQSVFRGVTDVNVSTSTSTTVDTALNVDEAGNLSTQSTARSDTTTTTDVTSGESFGRTGLQYSAGGKTITTRLGAKIIDSSLMPYIRTKNITYVAKHLKPNTEMYATFDNIDVTQYCFPAIELTLSSSIPDGSVITGVSQSSSGAAGNVILQKNTILYVIPDITRPVFTADTVTLTVVNGTPITRTVSGVVATTDLVTNSNGDIAGVFLIPNNQELKFNVGERQFKLADSLNKLFVTASAQTTYLAQGMSTTSQDTILATRMNLVSINPLAEYRQDNQGSITKTAQNTNTVVGEKSIVALPLTTQITNNITNVTENNTVINNTINEITNVTNNITDVSNYLTNVTNNTVVNNLTNITNNLSNVTNSIINNNITVNNNLNLTTGATNTGILDLFCGQNPQSSGKQGTFTYRINLGSGSLGQANIVCTSGAIPDRWTLTYRGVTQTPGFITTLNPNSTSGRDYSNSLVRMGYPENLTQKPSGHTFTIQKQTADLEFAYIEVNAPLEGTGWRFSIDCPTGSVNPAPGTAKIAITKGNSSQSFVANFDHYNGSKLANRPSTKTGIQITLTNTSSIPTWKVPGDGVVRVNSITIDDSQIVQPTGVATTMFGIETSGTSSQVYRGVENYIWNGSVSGYFRNNGNPPPSKSQSSSWTNTLGSLPANIPIGESRTFTVFFDHPAGSVANGKLKIELDLTNSAGTQPVAHSDIVIPVTTKNLTQIWIEDPIAQTFFVDGAADPNGIFLTSVDAWFAQKSNSIPVRCEIRPVVNGYPSSTEIVPFGATIVDAEKIVVSSVENTFSISENTRFTFPSPVYCPPGQYAIVLIGNDANYRIYSAVLGEFELGGETKRVTKQPYIGSMFKSQNSVTWTAEQFEDIAFRINRASFNTSNSASVRLDTVAPGHNVFYDVFYTFGESLIFPGTDASYGYRRTDNNSGLQDTDFVDYQLGTNAPMLSRKIVRANTNTSLQTRSRLYTEDEKVAPVIDLNRLSCVLVRNIINNDSTGEDEYSGGSAQARYITKRVSLAPGFEAQDLKVYVDVFSPAGTSFKVYFKVNAPGTTQFDSQNRYVEMSQISVSGNTRKGFAEFTFENSGNTCLPDGSAFNTFTIKIVMLSSNPAVVPIFKDLRVLALDDF